MAPNLLVATQKAAKPHRWFKSKPTEFAELEKREIWDSPVPGVYEHKLGHGWRLIAVRDADEFEELPQPVPVVYSRALHRHLLEEDFHDRKQSGVIIDKTALSEKLPGQKQRPLIFFRMDDGVTFVQCYDREGKFVPGPYKRYVRDDEAGGFRTMLKCDQAGGDDRRRSAPASNASSALSSLHTSPLPSGRNSIDERRPSGSFVRHGSSLKVPEERHAHGLSTVRSASAPR